MKIGFIGAGKVGTALGYYFYKKGVQVSGYYSKSYDSAIEASVNVEGKAMSNITALLKCADIIFVTTPDDEIEDVGKEIALLSETSKDHIFIHTSGAHSSQIFGNLHKKGYQIASMHPIQAFADFEIAVKQLEKTYFTLEGDDKALQCIKTILEMTGNTYFQIDESQKALYHAGACVLSNYLVTLMDYGLEFFRAVGLEEDKMFEAMLPLIKGTLNNIENKGCIDALTGPLVRGDVKTIENHLNFGQQLMDEKIELYKILGRKTLEMIEDKRITKEEIEEKYEGIL